MGGGGGHDFYAIGDVFSGDGRMISMRWGGGGGGHGFYAIGDVFSSDGRMISMRWGGGTMFSMRWRGGGAMFSMRWGFDVFYILCNGGMFSMRFFDSRWCLIMNFLA